MQIKPVYGFGISVAASAAFLGMSASPARAQARQFLRRDAGNAVTYDAGYAAQTDARGNVYVAASVNDGAGGDDFLTVKYDANGNVLWANRYNGPGNASDVPAALAVDSAGNVYVTGASTGATGAGLDYATVKYTAIGAQAWVARYNGVGSGDDEPVALVVDGAGGVYVTGSARGTTNTDYATVKYDPTGALVWARTFNGTSNADDYAASLTLDPTETYVLVTGTSPTTSNGPDMATLRYTTTLGTQNWVARYNGPAGSAGADIAVSVKTDGAGNVYVAGSSDASGKPSDFVLVKYTLAGAQLWASRYNGTGDGYDVASALSVDASGNAVIAGTSRGLLSGTSATGDDWALVKYDANGAAVWTTRFDSAAHGNDKLRALATDANGNLLAGGDTDAKGPGFLNGLVAKFAGANGSVVWSRTYDGPGASADGILALAADGGGNAIATGQSIAVFAPASGNTPADYDVLTLKFANAGYVATNLAVGGDDRARLLWQKSDGPVAVWRLNPVGNALESGVDVAAPTGYTASGFAVGSLDNKIRLFWRRDDNAAALWTLSNSNFGALETGVTFAPLPTFTPGAVAVGSDNKPRLMWNRTRGAGFSLWRTAEASPAIEANGTYTPTAAYKQLPVVTISPTDNKPRVPLPTVAQPNRAALWTLRENLTALETGGVTSTSVGYALVGATTGADNKTRVVWERADTGAILVSRLNLGGTAPETEATYDPPTGGFHFGAAAISPVDGKVRLLWTGLDGRAAVWTLNATGSAVESSQTYGPY